MSLADRPCVPAVAGQAPLTAEDQAPLARQLPAWRVVGGRRLARELRLPDFRSALALVVAIGELAEEVDHHPDLTLSWGRVGIALYTHAIGGLAEADFVLAARIERLIASQPSLPEPSP